MREDFDADFAARQAEVKAEAGKRYDKIISRPTQGFKYNPGRPSRRKAGRPPKTNVPIGGPEWSRPERAK